MNNNNQINLLIDETNQNQRLDKVLSQLDPISSRSLAQKYIQNKLVSVNNKHQRSSYISKINDLIIIDLPDTKKNTLSTYDLPLDILFEDNDIIVLNKPSGLVVHPAHGHTDKTLVNALLHHTKDLSMGINEERPGIVHRLDKETSGVMVVAKNNKSHIHLAEQFKNKSVHRIYHAITYGPVRKIETTYTIETSLIRHLKDRKKFASEKIAPDGLPKGKWASTTFTKINDYICGLSLLSCKLKTGRTHQIRVHLTELGFPIIGDQVYGNSSRSKNLKSVALRTKIKKLTRLGLNAAELGFIHPKTKKDLFFKTEWPEDMLDIINDLK